MFEDEKIELSLMHKIFDSVLKIGVAFSRFCMLGKVSCENDLFIS